MNVNAGPMLNAYPDSLGTTMKDLTTFLQKEELQQVFQSFYALPSVFHTDLDRGFSVISYELNKKLVKPEDIEAIKEMKMDLKFDFVLNHASVLSKEFQDIIKNGRNSKYKDFFIDWNQFWEGNGEMDENGCVKPYPHLMKHMFFRKPGLPILKVRMPNGEEVPYWNTFYQEVTYRLVDAQDMMELVHLQYEQANELADSINQCIKESRHPRETDWSGYEGCKDSVLEYLESRRRYLGQMDLNIKSPLVWKFYEETLAKLAEYGAKIVRLDAFAYAPKEPGAKNFLNEPGTWDLLEGIKKIADRHQLTLLPEIHATYEEKVHEKIAQKGYLTYDFFLPGLIIDAFERHSKQYLVTWIQDILSKNIKTVNMLGCHDGIPLLDLKGLLSEEEIQKLIDVVVKRGGYVKDLHGQKKVYYQVNATYYGALGEDDKKLLLARAIQIFMPGKPQVWYLDLFGGKNNYRAVELAGSSGHKEINRTNLTLEEMEEGLKNPLVQKQLELLRFRNTFQAFGFDSKLTINDSSDYILDCCWEREGYQAKLEANLIDYEFKIYATNHKGEQVYTPTL